jgi:iron uptake system EfeUOB component EfeO/EfeM
MKRFSFILMLVMSQEFAFASSQPTPVNVHVQRTPIEKLSIRLREQNIQIQRDEKAGKLTKAQAKALKAQVEAIRQQEIADLKQNGTKTLTDSQIDQLNGALNTLSKSIPIK